MQQSKNPFRNYDGNNEKIGENYEVIEEDPSNLTAQIKLMNTISEEDTLPGEVIKLRTFCSICPFQFPKLTVDGAFAITNYKASNIYNF